MDLRARNNNNVFFGQLSQSRDADIANLDQDSAAGEGEGDAQSAGGIPEESKESAAGDHQNSSGGSRQSGSLSN